MPRLLSLIAVLFALTACGSTAVDPEAPVEPLGDFRLGFVEVVAPNLEKLLISRDATKEELTTAVDKALEARFGRFEGDQLYHFGVSVEAYSLPPPVIPGKSALAMRVTVWHDASQSKLNEESEVISVIKVFESRLANSREDSILALANDVALETETWLRRMMAENGWFLPPAELAENTASEPVSEG